MQKVQAYANILDMSEKHKSELQYTSPVEITKSPSPDWQIQADTVLGSHRRNLRILELEKEKENNAKRIGELQLDALTGLPSRLMLDAELPAFLQRANGGGRRIGIAFVDVNSFKEVNDSLGHGVGDRYLQAVAAGMQGATRPGDRAYRLSGDEFVMLLDGDIEIPETETDDVAKAIGDRIKLHVGGELSGFEANKGVSVGVAFSQSWEEAASLIDRADRLMYVDKASQQQASISE